MIFPLFILAFIGKSPVIIDPKCDLKTAAKRILWGKVVNAGQTCVAPDYILVPKDFQDTLIQALKEVYVAAFCAFIMGFGIHLFSI